MDAMNHQVPVQILDFKDRNDEDGDGSFPLLELNKEALGSVLSKVGDKPVVVVSIAGASRQGKSFLMGFLLRYLRSVNDEDITDWMGWNEKERPLSEGFLWRNGINRQTCGIWLWNTPFFVKIGDTECAVLLMDTQGVYDDHTTPRQWSTIVGFSLLTSSVLIFNFFTNLQEDIFEKLQDFMQYGLLAKGELDDEEVKAFQKLIFLIRDWNFPGDFPYGARGGKEFLKTKLKIESHMPAAVKETRKNLTKCFDSLECFLMPYPGEDAKDLNFSGALSGLNKKFATEVEKFVNELLNSDKLQIKTIGGSEVTGNTLGQFIEQYVEMFNADIFPTPTTIYEATIRTANKNAITKARESYKSDMNKKIRLSKFLSSKDLKKMHTTAMKKANELFNETCKIGSSEEMIKEFQNLLNEEIQNEFEKLKLINNNKQQMAASEAVEESFNKFKEEMDEELSRGFVDDKKLKSVLEKGKESAVEEFNESMGDEDFLQPFISSLEEKLISQEETVLLKNQTLRTDAEKAVQSLVEQSLAIYNEDFEQSLADDHYVTKDILEEKHKVNMNNALEFFKKGKKPGNPQFVKQFQAQLNQSLEKQQQHFDSINEDHRLKFELKSEMLIVDCMVAYNESMSKFVTENSKATVKEFEEFNQQKLKATVSKFRDECNLSDPSTIEAFEKRLEEKIEHLFVQLLEKFEAEKIQSGKIVEKLAENAKNDFKDLMDKNLESDMFYSTEKFVLEIENVFKQILEEFKNNLQSESIPDESNKHSTEVEEELEKLKSKIIAKNEEKIVNYESRAKNMAHELQNSYQEEMKKHIETAATEDEFSSYHTPIKMAAINNFAAKCGPEISSKYVGPLEQEFDEAFAQLLELFKLKRQEHEMTMKQALMDAKRIYGEEMQKHLKTKGFIEPRVLQQAHQLASNNSVRNCGQKLTNFQEKELCSAMEKLFINYKEENEMNTPTNPAIGIDLGTTYSCVGVYLNGSVKIIPNRQGKNTTPSYVSFKGIPPTVGDPAKDQAPVYPEDTIYDSKRLIGRKFTDEVVQQDMNLWPFKVVDEGGIPKIEVGKKTYYPEQIAGFILEEMKKAAEDFLGLEVKNAVVTVPAYFTDGQKQATIDAGKLAGLNVLSIVHEPTAAAMAYRIQHSADVFSSRQVLIFDLGGGTFDVALLKISPGQIDGQCIGGDTHLGGEDFDRKLMEFCVEHLKTSEGIDLIQDKMSSNFSEKQRALKNLRRIQSECERRKIELSTSNEVAINVDTVYGADHDLNIQITRDQFEKMCESLFDDTINHVEKLVMDAGIDKDRVEDIVLVGGSSRIPKIQELLRQYFNGKQLNKTINPDEAVAYGAAIQAAILNGNIAQKSGNYVKLQDVTPHSLGVEVYLGGFSIIIPKSTTTPTSKKEIYKTAHNNQTSVQIVVFEGEQTIAQSNNKLGEFYLNGIPPADAGQQDIEVTMNINEQGILHVTAVCCSTGDKNDLTITEHKQRLSQQTIEKLLSDGKSVGA